jgi:hypothetical protein
MREAEHEVAVPAVERLERRDLAAIRGEDELAIAAGVEGQRAAPDRKVRAERRRKGR